MTKRPNERSRDRRLGVTLLAGLGFALATAATGAAAILIGRRRNRQDGHPAPDLDRDDRPGVEDRAEGHFRPEPTAVPSAAEREAFRHATMPVPPQAVSDPVVEPVAPDVPVRPLPPAT